LVNSNPSAAAINPVTNKIYVSNGYTGTLQVIDGATNATTTVAGMSNPQGIAVDPVKNKIFVANTNNTVTVIDGATNATTILPAGSGTYSIAVNPATNKAYAVNSSSNTVTIINGTTLDTATVAVGSSPNQIAVNPVTNKIYVVNRSGNSISVIDGSNNSVTTVPVGSSPQGIALNTVTNKIYVANNASNTVTEIDGLTNDTTSVATAAGPIAVAVNPSTNRIYAVCMSGNTVTVIDGASRDTTLIPGGAWMQYVSVNPITNKIYVVNGGAGASVMVIDGATNATSTLTSGTMTPFLRAVVVNPVTNKIYIAVDRNTGSSYNVTVIDGSSNKPATVTAANQPQDVAVNPVTNKIYVANHGFGANSVTVIDGATNAKVDVGAGTYPAAVAVNPVTNKIYAANENSNNVTVIDGATNATATVIAGTRPYAVAVNPVTNKVYVANVGSASVTVIDGATNATTTVAVGTQPCRVAVNPVTNRIYVANAASNNVTVIDGATNHTATVPAGGAPWSLAVNSVTNKIYVANMSSANVTVIDGANNATATVSAGSYPYSVAVNPATNKAYVANFYGNSVTVINGATNDTATVAVGTYPYAVAVDPVSNKVYVANSGSNNLTVIDGATKSTTTASTGTDPRAVAVNPVTNKIYTANYGSSNATVIDAVPVSESGVRAVIDSLSGNVAYQTKPVLTGKAVNRWIPSKTNMMGVLNDWMAGQEAWNWAAGPFDSTSSDSIGWTYNWGTDSLLFGENFINIVPLEMQSAGTNNLGLGTPFAGNMLTYPVYYLDSIPPAQVTLVAPVHDTLIGDSIISFVWHKASDNYSLGHYKFQVASNDSFSPAFRDTMVSDTTAVLTLSSSDTIYYWRVRAVDACGNVGEYSATWKFEIDVTSPAVPTLLTPADNAWLTLDTAFCTWSAVAKSGKAAPVYYVLKAYLLSDTINPVIIDTTSLTIDTLLISENRYRWLVEAHDEAGNPPGISDAFNFGYDVTPPATATLIIPNDSLITNQSNNNFIWNSCFDSISGLKEYTLQYAYDMSFSDGLAETTLTDTSITLAMADSNYYWRVIARDTVSNVSVSDIRYLSIDTQDPNIPSLSAPIDNLWTEDTTIICSWGEVTKKAKASEVSYVIQLDTTNTFATPIIEDTTGILLDTFNLAEGQYYWRVMAYDLAGNYGTYSTYRKFGIDTTAPLFQSVKALPDDPGAPYGPYEVTSSIYDLSGVKYAYMFTQINGGSWDSTAMFFSSDSLRDSIPELNPATDETLSVSYYIKATDMLDHQNTSSTYSFKAIGPLGVAGKPTSIIPTVYALDNAYPNPSRGQTTFKYQLPKESKVSLTVYNVVGQMIKRFDVGTKPAGYHQISWKDNTLPNGVYIYQLKAGTFSSTRKLMVLR